LKKKKTLNPAKSHQLNISNMSKAPGFVSPTALSPQAEKKMAKQQAKMAKQLAKKAKDGGGAQGEGGAQAEGVERGRVVHEKKETPLQRDRQFADMRNAMTILGKPGTTQGGNSNNTKERKDRNQTRVFIPEFAKFKEVHRLTSREIVGDPGTDLHLLGKELIIASRGSPKMLLLDFFLSERAGAYQCAQL
jgi:hypothetical protein